MRKYYFSQLTAVILAELISAGFYGVEARTIEMTESEMISEIEYSDIETSTEIVSQTETESEMETESETETELSGVTEEYICDDAGNPCIGSDGYALVKKETNKQGQVISERYYDLDKNPVICKKGYAQIRFEYDDAGNVITERYYDVDGQPLSLASGAHMVTRSFNDLKQKTEESYFDTDENPVLIDKGYAVIRFEYDEAGNVVCERYYDDSKGSDGSEEPEPIALASGAHMVTRSFNDLKQKTEESYFDTDENPVLIDKGYAVIRFEYDEAGNVVCESTMTIRRGRTGRKA